MNTRAEEQKTLPTLRQFLPAFEQDGLMHEPDTCEPDSIELIGRQSVPCAQSVLFVLATSAYLYSNDRRAFHDQTKQVLLNLIANNIVLNYAYGQQQVDALRGFERMSGELREKPRQPEQGFWLSNARR